MSKKIATFKDLDTLANLGASTSSGYITGATDEQCVTKENFNTVSDKTIEAKGNGLMFVEDSESSKYESSRLILLDDVQYISEITAELVSAPNIPAKGGSACATWLLTQYYKTIGDETQRVLKEWTVDGSNVSADSKGTTISTVTDVANSEVTVTNKGKSISLSQMIKQDLNKIEIYGDWTTPTVTVNPDSFAAAGGTATITISGDSTRENTWSSGSKSTDSAWISRASATLGTVSNDYKTLNIGLNDTSLDRSGNVIIEWSFDDGIVTTVESKKYSQVAQSSFTLTLNKVNKTYDGSASYITATASVSGTIYYGTSSSVMNNQIYVNGGDTVKLIECGRVDVGTTTVYAYLKPSSADYSDSSKEHAEINISNATFTVSAPDQTYEYTGSPHGAAITVSDLKGSQTETIMYGTTSGIYDTTTAPKITNANEDKIIYWQVTAPNHATQTGSYTITMNKATPTLTLSGTSVTYGSTATVTGKASVAGKIYYGTTSATSGMTSVQSASANTNYTLASRAAVGTTTVYAYFEPIDITNYNSLGSSSNDHTSASAVVSKATGYLTATVNTPLTYNGSAQTIATISANSGSYYFGFGSSTTSAPTSWGSANKALTVTNAGTYYVWAKCDAATKYNAVSAKYIGTVTIDKATPTLTLSGSSVSYGSTATVTGKASVAGKIYYGTTSATSGMTSVQNASANTNYTLASRTAVGTTTVYAYFEPIDITNYNSLGSSSNDHTSASAVVSKASNASIIVNTVNSTYTGSAQETLVAVTTNGVSTWTLGYTRSNTETVNSVSWGNEKSNLALTDAGTYYIWVKWESDSNHTGGSPNGEKTGKIVTINKRTVKITAPTATNCTYSGSAQTIFAAGSCTTGGTMYYSDIYQEEFSTSTWSKSPLPSTYTQKTNAGTYILYYYCYVSDTTNNTGTNINKILSISATINKKSATISFADSNLDVQCKNSATSLGIATNVRYLAATVTGGSVSYTIDSIQNPSGVTGTFISESQTALQLRVKMGTPVGDYSVDITASQSNPNYTSTPVTRTYKISVLPDTLGDYTGTLSISNPSTKLSAGDDTRTITWGAIHQVWKHGGNKVYMPYTANLTVSCNDSTAIKYVSINNKSYVNSSDTTTTTLTKTTYSSVYEHSIGATFTLELRTYDGTIIKTLGISADPNNKIHTLTAVNLSYSVADSTSGSTNIPTVTYNTTYGYQSGVVISKTTGNTSPKLDDNTTFTKSFEEYQSNDYASLNASTGVVKWNSSNQSSTVRTMTVKCTGTLTSNGVTSSKFVIKGASQNPYTTDSIHVSYVNQGVPYGCTYRVVAKGMSMTTIDNSTSNGIFHQETYNIPQLYIEVYGSNINSGTSKTLYVSWTGGGGTVTMEGTNKPAATVSNLSISIPSNTSLGSDSYYIVAKLTPSGSMTGSLTISIK